jgi:hypothetical protein
MEMMKPPLFIADPISNSPAHIVTPRHQRITHEYFKNEVLPVFNNICDSIVPIRRTYDIAGNIICMNFYSPKLYDKLHKAFGHIAVDSECFPHLTIGIWDSVSTNTQLSMPWKKEAEYIHPRQAHSKMLIQDSFLGTYLRGEGSLNLYDETNNSAYFWVHNADCLPYRLSASPLRSILNWFLSKKGFHLIHGAVVCLDGKSILITAKGGTGKSTAALSCFLSGMSFLGDDMVLLKYDEVITTHSIFNSAKLFLESFHHSFPELKDKLWNESRTDMENEKVIVFLSEFFPQKVIKSAPLYAIMIPFIKNVENTRIIPAGKMQTMISMIPTSLFQVSFSQSNIMAELRSIVEKTPCYFLELGSDFKGIAKTIQSFLSHEQ